MILITAAWGDEKLAPPRTTRKVDAGSAGAGLGNRGNQEVGTQEELPVPAPTALILGEFQEEGAHGGDSALAGLVHHASEVRAKGFA